MTGLHLRNTSSLNKDLDHYDLPQLNGSLIGTGIGGGIFMKNFFIGGQGMIQFSSGTSNDFYEADLFEGYGMLQGGYVLANLPSVAFYPTLGIGGGGTSIRLEEGSSYDDIDLEFLADSDIHTSAPVTKFVTLLTDSFSPYPPFRWSGGRLSSSKALCSIGYTRFSFFDLTKNILVLSITNLMPGALVICCWISGLMAISILARVEGKNF